MKIPWTRLLPFAAALAFSLGCVVFSCVSPSPHWVNTGRDGEGKIRTTRLFSRIDRIVVLDFKDRSRRHEPAAGEWTYDRETSELRFSKDLPFADPVVHVEGLPEEPAAFVLGDLKGGAESLFVVLGGRLAIRDYDYVFDEGRSRLVFRGGLDLEKEKFFISYDTRIGASSFGNLDVTKDDRLAYLEAENRSRLLREWYAGREEFWFFAGSAVPGEKPALVKRRPTLEERRRMESFPATVIKPRFGVSGAKVSREAGFDVRTPESLKLGFSGKVYSTLGKILEESPGPSGLRFTVSEIYRDEAADRYDNGRELIVRMSSAAGAGWDGDEPELVIERSELDLGLRVKKRVVWAQRVQGGLDEKPEVVRLALYEWTDRGVRFGVSADENVPGGEIEDFIEKIIAFRR